jgi:type II secretory pathway component GspD/PulD (secretin)
MKSNCNAAAPRGFRSAQLFVAFLLTAAFAAPTALAQSAPSEANAADAKSTTETTQTIFLTNVTQQNELNDVQTDLRNMFSKAKIYSVTSQNAISIHGTPEDIETAQKIVSELDRPRKIYRLTYTITEFDSGTRTGTQTFAVVAASGERSIFKQGSRVPIVTGSYDNDTSKANTQVQYQDVGLSIDSTVQGRADGVSLRSKVEQSSPAEEKSGLGAQDPVIRQSVLESTTGLTLGKPLVLGSVDVPGSTRKREITVVAEIVK